MGCMENALNNLFPVGWLDPYGCMPLNKEYSVQIDITQVETDDGIKVTAVKTPPRAGTTSVQDAISMALGMGCCDSEAPTNSQQSADQGKRDNEDQEKESKDKPDFADKSQKTPSSGKIDASNHLGSEADRDRNPGPGGREKSGTPSVAGDSKEKGPWK